MITERIQAIGDWSVTLDPDTPRHIREAVKDPFSHVVVTPQWHDPNALSDTGMLTLSRYTGVVLEPGPQLELRGPGLAWWLGNADDQGGIKYTGVHFFSADTWFDVYEDLLGPDLDMGTITPSGGSYTGTFNLVTRRSAIDSVAATAGHVWRVNPNGTFDVEANNSVFPTPRVILIDGRSGRGYDAMTAVDCDIRVRRDYELWASDVSVIGQDATYGNGIATTAYKSLTGANVHRLLVFDGSDIPVGLTNAMSATLYAKYGVNEGRRIVEVEARDPDVTSFVKCGDRVYVYAPLQGLEDVVNYVFMAGEPTWPVEMQVTAMSWPLLRGMGVYHRRYLEADGAPVWTDLTPYVVFEDGSASLEVVVGGDADRWNMVNATGRADVVAAAQDRRRGSSWDTYTPSWTSSGTQPAIVNGTISGWFRREGTTGYFQVWIAPGSSTTFGTGSYSIGLPTGWVAASGREQWDINCKWGGAANYRGGGGISAGASTFIPQFPNTGTPAQLAAWTPTAPATFANGTNFFAGGTVELAP